MLRCPVPQSSAETVLESVALETREVKTSYNTGLDRTRRSGAGGVVVLVIVKKKKDDEDE